MHDQRMPSGSKRGSKRGPRGLTLLVAVMIAAMVAAACGSGASSKAGSTTTAGNAPSTTAGPISKTLGVGVTAKTIRIGVAMIDYEPIKQYVHNTDGNQKETYQVFFDDINKHGGVGGRKLVPYYHQYVSIGSTGPLAACASLIDDKKVFATIGVLYDATGAGQLCFTKQHKSILITHELTQSVIDKAPPGTLLTIDVTPERGVSTLITLLKKEKTLAGKTVAVLGSTNSKASIESTIVPGLKAAGIKTGSTGILTISGEDTTAAQNTLDSYIERWKSEGVKAVLFSGDEAVASQFVRKVSKGIPGVLMLTDSSASAMHNAAAEPNPNPFQGMLTAQGLTSQDNFLQPSVQACATTYKNALGKKVIAPADLKPGPDGNKVFVYDAMELACEDLAFFKYVAEKVGPYLNNENWVQTINNLGNIDNVIPGTHYASMHAGKYDAADDSGLAAFDQSIEDFKLTTPIINSRPSG
jgi:ABC-type branched-subunit amino acid transport system substrate-binding protein